MVKLNVIIRHNQITNHYYVHSNGHADWSTINPVDASEEMRRTSSNVHAHTAWVTDEFKSTRQARQYCLLRGQGLDHDTAVIRSNI